mgnify:CR=1 FL=1
MDHMSNYTDYGDSMSWNGYGSRLNFERALIRIYYACKNRNDICLSCSIILEPNST